MKMNEGPTQHTTTSGARSSLATTSEPEAKLSLMSCSPPDDSCIHVPPAEASGIEKRWKAWSDKVLKNDAWGRLWRILDKIPKEISILYDRIESNSKGEVKFDDVQRNKIYKEFFRIASTSFGELNVWEVDSLIQSDVIMNVLEFQDVGLNTKKKLAVEALKKSSSGGPYSVDQRETYDFEKFIVLLNDMVVLKTTYLNRKKQNLSYQFRIYFPLDPEMPAKQIWDILMMIILIYCSFDVPYNLAFSEEQSDGVWSLYEQWGLLLDCTLLLDIVLTFVTAIEVKGVMVFKFRAIANQYIRTWFFLDLLGSFPFDVVLQAVLSATLHGSGAIQILRVFKLVRMAKLLRTYRFFSRLNQLSRNERFAIFASFFSVFKAVFLLAFTAHTFGSIFTIILEDEGPNWIRNYRSGELENAGSFSRYVLSLYWATVSLTTMGYGDVVPVNTQERMLCILVAMSGSVVFSFCIGSLSSLMTDAKGADHTYRARVRTVRDYLDFRDISVVLKRRIRAYYTQSWMQSGAPYKEISILEDLTPSMRSSLLREIGASIQRDLAIFQGLDFECIGYIYSRLRSIEFEEEEVIYERGDAASHMYIVVSGKVTLYQRATAAADKSFSFKPGMGSPTPERGDGTHLGSGDTFGELSLFPDLSGTKMRPDAAVAATRVTAFTLSLKEIDDLHSHYPIVVQKLRELCVLRALECKVNGMLPMPAEVASVGMEQLKLNIRISQLQRDLLRRKETEVLRPAAADDGSGVMHFMLLPDANSTAGISGSAESDAARDAGWLSVSCVVSGAGELLCIEHSAAGLGMEGAQSLGFVVAGRSVCRALSTKEVAAYIPDPGRMLLGYAVTVFPFQNGEGGEKRNRETEGRRLLLFSATKYDFDELLEFIPQSPAAPAGLVRRESSSAARRGPSQPLRSAGAVRSSGLVLVSRKSKRGGDKTIVGERCAARPAVISTHVQRSSDSVCGIVVSSSCSVPQILPMPQGRSRSSSPAHRSCGYGVEGYSEQLPQLSRSDIRMQQPPQAAWRRANINIQDPLVDMAGNGCACGWGRALAEITRLAKENALLMAENKLLVTGSGASCHENLSQSATAGAVQAASQSDSVQTDTQNGAAESGASCIDDLTVAAGLAAAAFKGKHFQNADQNVISLADSSTQFKQLSCTSSAAQRKTAATVTATHGCVQVGGTAAAFPAVQSDGHQMLERSDESSSSPIRLEPVPPRTAVPQISLRALPNQGFSVSSASSSCRAIVERPLNEQNGSCKAPPEIARLPSAPFDQPSALTSAWIRQRNPATMAIKEAAIMGGDPCPELMSLLPRLMASTYSGPSSKTAGITEQINPGLKHVEPLPTTADTVEDATNHRLPQAHGLADELGGSSNGLGGDGWRMEPPVDEQCEGRAVGLTVLDLEAGIRGIARSAAAAADTQLASRLSKARASGSNGGGGGGKNALNPSVQRLM